MSRISAYLGRFAAMILGFACATLAASAFFHVLVIAGAGLGVGEDFATDLMASTFIISVLLVATFIAYATLLPAFVFFVLAEMLGLRDWLWHALGGGAAAIAALLMQDQTFSELSSPDGRFFIAATVSGMVGGIAYWAVSGRRAGDWRDRVSAAPPQE